MQTFVNPPTQQALEAEPGARRAGANGGKSPSLPHHPRTMSENPQAHDALAATVGDGDAVTMEKIVALCKRRGFIFPSSEIYGGIGSTYDYGHYGVLLKTNVKNEWWRAMVGRRDDIVALDSAILQHPRVWEGS